MIQRKAIREAYPVVLFSFIVVGMTQWENSFSPGSTRIEKLSTESTTREGGCGINKDLRVRSCVASLSAAAKDTSKN